MCGSADVVNRAYSLNQICDRWRIPRYGITLADYIKCGGRWLEPAGGRRLSRISDMAGPGFGADAAVTTALPGISRLREEPQRQCCKVAPESKRAVPAPQLPEAWWPYSRSHEGKSVRQAGHTTSPSDGGWRLFLVSRGKVHDLLIPGGDGELI